MFQNSGVESGHKFTGGSLHEVRQRQAAEVQANADIKFTDENWLLTVAACQHC